MELHPFEGRFGVVFPYPAKTHDDFCLASFDRINARSAHFPSILIDLKIGNRVAPHDERVVSGDNSRRFNPIKQPFAIVHNLRCFAVHQNRMTLNNHLMQVGHTLMTKAHPKYGNAPRKVRDDLTRHTCFFRRARPGRDNHMTRTESII